MVNIQHTLDFIKTNLPETKIKILEVGCGNGDLAVELKKCGYFVTAMDVSEEAVSISKAKDIDVVLSDFLKYETELKFDAILFSRSLHHIFPLDAALKKAKSLLAAKGRLVVEDFSYEEMDEKTAKLFYEMKDLVSLMSGNKGDIHEEINPMDRWKQHHEEEHKIHPSKEMLAGIERNFETSYVSKAPYLYRYFAKDLDKLENGAAVLQKLYDWENKLIENKTIQPLGLRTVSKMFFSYLR